MQHNSNNNSKQQQVTQPLWTVSQPVADAHYSYSYSLHLSSMQFIQSLSYKLTYLHQYWLSYIYILHADRHTYLSFDSLTCLTPTQAQISIYLLCITRMYVWFYFHMSYNVLSSVLSQQLETNLQKQFWISFKIQIYKKYIFKHTQALYCQVKAGPNVKCINIRLIENSLIVSWRFSLSVVHTNTLIHT